MQAIESGAPDMRAPATQRSSGATTDVVIGALMVLVYVALDYATFAGGIARTGFASWNPSSGVVLAYVASFGMRRVPLAVLAVLLGELIVRQRNGFPEALALAAVSAACLIAAGLIWRALWQRGNLLATLRGTALFVALNVGAACTYGAVYVGVAYLLGLPVGDRWVNSASDFAGAELLGMLLIAPILVRGGALLGERGIAAFVPSAEVLAMALSIPLTLAFLYGTSEPSPRRFFYVLFLPLIWIALRQGVLGATLAVLGAHLLIIVAIQVLELPPPLLLNLQFLLIVLAVTGMFLGAAAMQSRASDARREAREAELRTIFDTAPSALLMLDAAGRVQSANPAASRLLRVEHRALLGRPLSDLVPGLALEGALGRIVDTQAMRGDGEAIPVELSLGRGAGPTAPYVAVIRDLISRREMEARFARQQADLERTMRMAAVSEMAISLAHELNQPLSAATSYVRACNRLLSGGYAANDPRLATAIEGATREMTRASDIVRRLRDFFRTGSGQLEKARLDEVIAEALAPLADRIARGGVEIVQRYAQPLPAVLIDRLHVGAVIQNLVINAIQALAANPPAERRIEIDVALRGGAIRVVVADNGPGIAPALRATLFDPFSTTKTEGLGLGLALSRALIEGQGGTLQLEGAEGHAVFSIHFPIREADAASVA